MYFFFNRYVAQYKRTKNTFQHKRVFRFGIEKDPSQEDGSEELGFGTLTLERF